MARVRHPCTSRHLGATVVVAVDVLFAVSGSGVLAVTLAVFVSHGSKPRDDARQKCEQSDFKRSGNTVR